MFMIICVCIVGQLEAASIYQDGGKLKGGKVCTTGVADRIKIPLQTHLRAYALFPVNAS